jgi:hypothetical protein
MPKRVLEVAIIGDASSLKRTLGSARGEVGKFSKQTDTASRGMSKFRTSLGGVARAAAGAAAAYVGISQAKQAVSTTTDLAKATIGLHKNLGLTIEKASEWAAVAKTRNVDTKALNMSFGTLSKNVEAATKGTGAQAEAFKTLGLSQAELKKGDFNQILGDVADGMAKLKPGTEKTAIAMKLFGRGWQTVVPVIRDGSKGMNEQLALAKKYGATFGGHTIRSMQDFIRAQREAKFASLGLQIAFATTIAPALTKVIGTVAKLVNGFRNLPGPLKAAALAAAGLAAAFVFGGPIGLAIAAVAAGAILIAKNWKTIGPIFQSVEKWVTTAFSNVKAALGSAVAFIKHNLGLSGADMARFGQAIKNIWTVVKIVLSPLLAYWKFGFGQMLAVVRRVWPGIKAMIGGALQIIGGLIKVFSGILTGHFGRAWAGVKQIFRGALTYLGGLIRAFTAPLRQAMATMAHAVTSVFGGAWRKLRSIASGVLSAIKGAIRIAAKVFGDVIAGILRRFATLFDVASHLPIIGHKFKGLAGQARSAADKVDQLGENINRLPTKKQITIQVNALLSDFEAGKVPKLKPLGSLGGRARGGFVNEPMVMVGEEAPRHPEYVVATNPAYRKRNMGLWAQAGHDLGIPGFAEGGVMGRLTGALNTDISRMIANKIRKSRVIGGGLAMLGAMNSINAKGFPYVYGGGHGSFSGPYDCSGAVSAVLHAAGLLGSPMSTDGLKNYGESGPGKFVTIGVRGSTGRNAHTMMEAFGRFFESGGGHGAAITAGWDGSFPIKRHPTGFARGGVLGKVKGIAKVAAPELFDPHSPHFVGWGLAKGGPLARATRHRRDYNYHAFVDWMRRHFYGPPPPHSHNMAYAEMRNKLHDYLTHWPSRRRARHYQRKWNHGDRWAKGGLLPYGLPGLAKGGRWQRALTALRRAGFKGGGLRTALAVGGAESVDYTQFVGDHGSSFGPWQVHIPAHPEFNGPRMIHDWTYGAKAAYKISDGGRNWGPWTTFNTGAFRRFLGKAAATILAGRRSRKRGGGGGGGGSRHGGGSSPAPHEKPTHGATSAGISDTLAELEVESARASGTPGLADDISVYRQKGSILKDQARGIKARLAAINKALRGKLTKATRSRLIGERTDLLGQLAGIVQEQSDRVKAFRDAIDNLKTSLADLATQAAANWRAAREKGIDDKLNAAIAAIDNSAAGKALASITARQAARQDATDTAALAKLQDRYARAKAAGASASTLDKIQADIDDLQAGLLERQIQKQKDAAQAKADAEKGGLDKQEAALTASLNRQLGALLAMLAKGKTGYIDFVAAVQAILAPLGVIFSGTPEDAQAIGGGQPGHGGGRGGGKEPKLPKGSKRGDTIHTRKGNKRFPGAIGYRSLGRNHGIEVFDVFFGDGHSEVWDYDYSGAHEGAWKRKRRFGGPVKAGVPYVVGEDGPEVYVPGRDGRIVPNPRTTGGAQGPLVHIENYNAHGPRDAEKLAHKLAWRVATAAV